MALDDLWHDLGEICPLFVLSGNNVHVIKEPSNFYEKLLELSAKAHRRIVLSSLYLGTGDLEKNLVLSLSAALQRGVKLTVLLDYSRGTRGEPNSCSLLLPLLSDHRENADVHLFHSPLLRGTLKLVLPTRWNEVVSVQHMKLYIFDDTLIISGANLSCSYFTNRQDRYVLIADCIHLTDFYVDLIASVSRFSFRLGADGQLSLSEGVEHPFLGSFSRFCSAMKAELTTVINHWRNRQSEAANLGDTKIFPLVQMGAIGLRNEQRALQLILRHFDHNATKLHLASGYFNMTSYFSELVFNSKIGCDILTASPQANGFFNASGFSGYIPSIYDYFTRSFLVRVDELKKSGCIALHEYGRRNWTFHAKGMWLTSPFKNYPLVTVVGSTNFGYRSFHKDLETQLVISTENRGLRKQLEEERENLFSTAELVNFHVSHRLRQPLPFFVRLFARSFRNYF